MGLRLLANVMAVVLGASSLAGHAWAQSVEGAGTAVHAQEQAAGDPAVGAVAGQTPANDDGAAGAEATSAATVAPVVVDRAAVAANVKKVIEVEFPGIEVAGVTPTPFDGLYEVQVGMDLLYTNANADFLLQGALIDIHTRTDLTAQRLAKLSEVPFDSLPLDAAIKQVKGKGERKMVVFEDPNCGYCKRLHQTLEHIDNVTIYTLLFPILSPDSTEKARNIWCASDRVSAWRDWMLQAKVPAPAECDTPIQANLALGRSLMVRGTPAIFFADGSRINGALPLPQLKEKLDSLGPEK